MLLKNKRKNNKNLVKKKVLKNKRKKNNCKSMNTNLIIMKAIESIITITSFHLRWLKIIKKYHFRTFLFIKCKMLKTYGQCLEDCVSIKTKMKPYLLVECWRFYIFKIKKRKRHKQ
jgi:hypothetical protein